eukprot:1315709-Pyramimonas_sp.AAC.1
MQALTRHTIVRLVKARGFALPSCGSRVLTEKRSSLRFSRQGNRMRLHSSVTGGPLSEVEFLDRNDAPSIAYRRVRGVRGDLPG